MIGISKIGSLGLVVAILATSSVSLAEEDDGDWDFLNRHLPDEETMKTFVRNRERTDTFRFIPHALRFMGNADTITVFEGLPHSTWEPELLEKELDKSEEILIGEYPFYPEPTEVAKKIIPRF